MWKLYHKIFGWDYIAVPFGYRFKIVRIKTAPNKKLYYTIYSDIRFFEISNISKIHWLTCAPKKYFPFY